MDYVKLTLDVLSVEEVTSLITDPTCGAISLFVGTTRDNFQGKNVERLEYEAYNEMAEKEMHKLCKQAREKWSLKHIALYHRLGLVPVTESSVIVAVSSEHRRESLDAVSFLIDSLKASVPIWKKEVYNDGSGEWKKNKECMWVKNDGSSDYKEDETINTRKSLKMSASSVNPESCPICKGELEHAGDVVQIRQKGADGINSASVQRGDNIIVTVGQKVHLNCRKRYTSQNDIQNRLSKKSGSSNPIRRSTHVSDGPFDSKTDCLFCGTSISPGSSGFSRVKTDTFTRTILQCCDGRSDDWSFTVKGRIEYYAGDLHAADCLYHHSCSGNFRSGLDIPLQFQSGPKVKRRKSGRPKDEDQERAFSKMCSYLEINDEEQLTISDLRSKMKEFLTSKDPLPYGNQYVKSKLKEQYGNSIYIAKGEGIHAIVTMKEKPSQILRSYFKHKSNEGDEELQKKAIIETAARLIKSDIKLDVPSVTHQHPRSQVLELDSALTYIPDSLQTMLNFLFAGKNTQRKVAGIGQAIVQAVRPRAVLVPLQIGLAVQMHNLYNSKFIVDTLSEMGFCSTYEEVLRFEKNAANFVAPDMLGGEIDFLETALLFTRDNVDHNIFTIDGEGIFHEDNEEL